MILQSLARYYDILLKDPDINIAPFGYSTVNVSFALTISEDGKLQDILPMFQNVQRGKKIVEIPRPMLVPEQVKRASGIRANFLCDNCTYVLGISNKEPKDPDYSAKRFAAFKELHNKLLVNVDSDAARAVLLFLNQHNPVTATEHPVISSYLEALLRGGNIVFMYRNQFVHEDAAIKKAWETYKAEQDAITMQCLVTGEIGPIARLHPSIKGIVGSQSTGATLVGFNLPAFRSYNRDNKDEKGLNAPVSQKAVFAYSTALNYLLSDANPNRKFYIGDTTVIYWAESENRAHETAFAGIIAPEDIVDTSGRPKKAEAALKVAAEKVRRIQAVDLDALLANLGDENPRFFVLGLAPNAARVSVRFFITDPFQKIIQNIMLHYSDLRIIKEKDEQPDYITIRHILDETVPKISQNKRISPLLAGTVFRSILTNSPYPAALYYAIINRVRAETDDFSKNTRKINYIRAAVIKAYLLRKYRHQTANPIKEVLKMALNEHSTNPAYLLGRLFAVLEKVQQEAIGTLNASIKDRYFTSACASPGSVFPILLRLSQHHIAKAEYGYASEHLIQEILNKLDVENNPIPPRLTLDEQGVFILGYYHQRAAFFQKKEPLEDPAQ